MVLPLQHVLRWGHCTRFWRQWNYPQTWGTRPGGAYISEAFEAVCARLEIHHEPIVSTHGDSYKNLMETHFNVQRRLYDYQFSLTQTSAEFEQVT
jgi:hypothetical protein